MLGHRVKERSDDAQRSKEYVRVDAAGELEEVSAAIVDDHGAERWEYCQCRPSDFNSNIEGTKGDKASRIGVPLGVGIKQVDDCAE